MIIYTIGGFNEVGKNMSVVDLGDDAIMFDSGFYLPVVIKLQEQETQVKYTEKKLRQIGAIADDLILDRQGVRQKVRAILLSHAHLDHLGAIPYMSYRYNAPIVGTPFTVAVLKKILGDEKIQIPNKLHVVKPNSSFIIKGKKRNYKAEFINITHSTLQTSMIALHTPEGVVLYANDFKIDNTPVLGQPPNYYTLRKIAKQGIKALIVDSLYSGSETKTPSEKIARAMLEETLLTIQNRNSAVFVPTFSSHIARLKSIVDFGKRMNRKIVFVGRSLNKYVSAAKEVHMCPFQKNITLVSYKKQVQSMLKKIDKDRTKYLVVCTGHQGEPGSILERISRKELPFEFKQNDNVIFSSKTIPAEVNIANKGIIDKRLKKQGVRIFDNVHVSVLPNTQVVINDSTGIKIKKIKEIKDDEQKEIKVPAFDPLDLKIKWFDAKLIKHDYNGKIFNIKTKTGRSVSITSGHSLFKLEKDEVVSEKGDTLKEGDYLAIPKKFSWYKQVRGIDIQEYIHLNNKHYHKEDNMLFFDKIPICPLKIKLTKDFARLLGYYLAEGSSPRHISLVIGKHEEENLKEIVKSIKNCFPSNLKIIDKGTSYEIVFGARTLRNLFKCWFGDNAKSKRIPRFIFSSSDEFKLNFLGAYINGDGSLDKGKKHLRLRIKTASEKLASDLLYLFSQLGVCAKFDHIEKGKQRMIGKNKKETPETFSYVIRIQGKEYLFRLKDFLSNKFKLQIEKNLEQVRFSQKLPPESLPIEKLNLDEVYPKKGTYLWDIKYYRKNSKNKKKHINRELILKQAHSINGFTNRILNGDLLFDPIVSIETSNYKGSVYDFKVSGAQNFIGGFGGVMLHNSGHPGREDLRDLLEILHPEHIIPAHGTTAQLTPMIELCREMGFESGKKVHLMQDGQKIKL